MGGCRGMPGYYSRSTVGSYVEGTRRRTRRLGRMGRQGEGGEEREEEVNKDIRYTDRSARSEAIR